MVKLSKKLGSKVTAKKADLLVLIAWSFSYTKAGNLFGVSVSDIFAFFCYCCYCCFYCYYCCCFLITFSCP